MSEFGVAQGQTFTAVELVTGLDVMRLVAESRLGASAIPAGGALALISQAARAVGYAHGRGLSHLGLSPTNVIVTVEGDVKVTDFGILAATIPARPVDAPRLVSRIGYLAPEQLVGEATSAATDVFVLGVIAYELVTGQRAFFGDSPVADRERDPRRAAGRTAAAAPDRARAARCLARSQFERFPDARAFADALDAALRVAPVPGTRKDIGAQVKSVLDRHAAMNEGNLSGVVALNLNYARPASFAPPASHAPDEGGPTTEFVRPDVEVARPAPLVGPASGRTAAGTHDPAATIPDLPKPLTTTVPGLVPPIPTAPLVPPPIPSPGQAPTLLGLSAGRRPQIGPPQIPSLRPKSGPLPPPGMPATLPSTVPTSVPAAIPSIVRPAGLPAMPPGAKATGAPALLRQTQPGAGSPPVRTDSARPASLASPADEIDEFGRPRRALVGPTAGLGAPGRPPSDSETTRIRRRTARRGAAHAAQ